MCRLVCVDEDRPLTLEVDCRKIGSTSEWRGRVLLEASRLTRAEWRPLTDSSRTAAGEVRDPFERPGFLEEVRRTRHDLEPHDAAHPSHGILIHRDHRGVAPADDEQRRSGRHSGQRAGSQIRWP